MNAIDCSFELSEIKDGIPFLIDADSHETSGRSPLSEGSGAMASQGVLNQSSLLEAGSSRAAPNGWETDCHRCEIRKSGEFCVLSAAELYTTDRDKKTRHYGGGDFIYHEGDSCTGVFIVVSGLVGVRKIDAWGNTVLLRLVAPGGTLGYRSMLAGSMHHNNAEAMKTTTLCFLPIATVRGMIARNPELGLRFLQHAASDLADAEEHVLRTSTQTVRARLAHLLLVLKERYSEPGQNGAFVLNLPMSRRDMAAMIGIRPESMSRAVRTLENDNIASFKGRRVSVAAVSSLVNLLSER